ncbi:MAG: hypothetical protein REI12_06650, partial [Pedobacter sp.]|nr:hypothetical protein [Pedobacter sp.]
LLLGADYQVLRNVTLLAEQEWAWSSDYNTQTSRAGVKYQPWKGANFTSHLDHETLESGERLRAGLGLGQRLTLTPEWTMDLGYDQAATLKDARTSTFNPAQPPVFGPANSDDFWAAFAGANYQYSDIKGVGRLERREGEASNQWNLVGGVYRELNAEMAIAAGLTATFADEAAGSSTDRSLLRGSLAWRPDRLRWLLLEQLDYGMDKQDSISGSSIAGQRLVNNLNASKRWERDQLSLQYGAKYVFATIDDSRVSGFTDLMGGEWRHDLNERWDIGLRGSVLHSWGPGVMDYSMGVSVGVTPIPNAWLSLGFNFTGFRDSDFSGSEYSAQGVYLKMRLKVDQDSIRQIWNDARGVFGSGSAAPVVETEKKTEALVQPEQNLDALAAPAPASAAEIVVPENVLPVPVVAEPAPQLAAPATIMPAKSVSKPRTNTGKNAVKTSAIKPVSKPVVAAASVKAAPKAPAMVSGKAVDDALSKQQRMLEHRAMVKERMQRQARLERLERNDRTIQKVLKIEEPVKVASAKPEKTQVTLEREQRRIAKEREQEIKLRRERMQREKEKAEKLLQR